MNSPTIQVPRLHRDLWRHEEQLAVFLLCRSLFNNLTGPQRIRCQKKRERAHHFQSFTKDYLHQNCHGMDITRVQDVADSLWEKGQFLPNSPLNDLFRAYTDQRTKTESFRASIGLPPLVGPLDNSASHLADKYTPPSRSRLLQPPENPLHAGLFKSKHIGRCVSKPDDGTSRIMESGAIKKLQKPSLSSTAQSVAANLDRFKKSRHQVFSRTFGKKNWTQPEAVEYTVWGYTLTQFRDEISGKLGIGYTFDCVSYFYQRLTDVRHLAVHRRAGVPIEAVHSMCEDARSLARALGDHPRATLLGFLQQEVLSYGEALINGHNYNSPVVNIKSMWKEFKEAVQESVLDSEEIANLYNNMFPAVMQVLQGKDAKLHVYCDDLSFIGEVEQGKSLSGEESSKQKLSQQPGVLSGVDDGPKPGGKCTESTAAHNNTLLASPETETGVPVGREVIDLTKDEIIDLTKDEIIDLTGDD